jgi:hypothetical protein
LNISVSIYYVYSNNFLFGLLVLMVLVYALSAFNKTKKKQISLIFLMSVMLWPSLSAVLWSCNILLDWVFIYAKVNCTLDFILIIIQLEIKLAVLEEHRWLYLWKRQYSLGYHLCSNMFNLGLLLVELH